MGRMMDLPKIRLVRVLSAVMVVLVIAAALPLTAGAVKVFTDVEETDWFNSYILKVKENSLMSGYEDATFKPNVSINKVEVMVALCKLVGFQSSDSSLVVYTAKYSSVMQSNRIPDWSRDYIAYALEKGIIQQEELATFIKSDGTVNNAKRYEVAIFLVRALGLEQEAKSYGNIILDFKDNELISQGTRGYIKILKDRNIMKGDAEGKFNPNNEITRAEFATVLATSLDYAGSVITPPADTGTTTIEGTIEEVVRGTGRTIIKISLSDGDIDIYDVDTAATVRIEGLTSTIASVAAGQQGSFGIKDNKIVSVNVSSSAADVEGMVRSVYTGTEYGLLTVEKDSGGSVTYNVPTTAVIRLDGTTVTLNRLSSGDKVKVTASGTNATRVEAETKTRTAMGIFNGLKTDAGLILILKKGTQEIEYPVDDDVTVKRDGRTRTLTDLRKGDEIEITTEYGIITSIVAESSDRDVEGTIYSLLIARPHQLTILTKNGDLETFSVPVDVDIEIDGKTASIYDLRLDYKVEVEVESDEVVTIEADSVVSQNEIVGTVQYVNTDVNVITMRVLDSSTGSYTSRQINVNDSTRIINSSGTRRYIRHIEVGDRLVVVGHSELGVFIADTIIITNQ